MKILNDVVKVERFFADFHQTTNRGYAWIDCNNAFTEIKKTKISNEQVAKELFIFLANWGMVARGAFLMQHTYRILIPVVEILTKDEYQILQNLEIDFVEKNAELIIGLKNEINESLREYSSNKEENVTDTVLSKIMMGALGCTVAYDTNVRRVLSSEDDLSPSFNEDSIIKICEYYKKNNIEKLRQNPKLKKPDGNPYPPMKFFDNLLWFNYETESEELKEDIYGSLETYKVFTEIKDETLSKITIKNLPDFIKNGEIQAGSKELVSKGKIDATFENLIVKHKVLFSKDLLDIAKFKLNEYRALL